jgi:HlyD family secretion protein
MYRFLSKPVVALGILLLLLAGVIGFWSWHLWSAHNTAFNTVEVAKGDLVATIRATGTIEPLEVVDVGAQVAGLITAFGRDVNGKAIDYGSVVEEGGVLANIDDSVYAADLALARAQVEQDKAGELSAAANLQQAHAKLDQNEADWKRAEELSRSKLLATADYDSYKANYEIAKANVSVGEAAVAQAKAATIQARAQLDKAQRNLDFCVIKSPVKGVIIDRRVSIGQTVVASLNAPSLFLIAKDLTKMQIWAAVNEADVGRIARGGPVTFTCDTFPDREFTGKVAKTRLNATMTQNVVMYTVEVDIENPDNILLPYLTANVRFVVNSETNALLVPNAALRWVPSDVAQIAPGVRGWKPIEADPPAGLGQGLGAEQSQTQKGLGTVWMKQGEFVTPVDVRLGASDGTYTAVTSETLRPGQGVVTGETAGTAQAARQNPFIPQFRRR